MVFGGSQVLMDLEPGYRMLTGDTLLHGPTHTLAGALLIGIAATSIGKPISEFALRLLRFSQTEISWTAAALGAFAGTFSHVFLDGIMHSDMLPFLPFSESNSILGLISSYWLHTTCLLLGIAGVLILLVRYKISDDA